MSTTTRILIAVLIIVFACNAVGEAAVRRVPARLNVLEFYGGLSDPVGGYDAFTFDEFASDFRPTKDIDGDDIYEPTFHLGVSYGQMLAQRFLVSFGFRYTKHELEDMFYISGDSIYVDWWNDLGMEMHQYDLELNLNYYLLNLVEAPISPYVGGGLRTGITNTTFDDFESENDFTMALALNFGFDFKFWQNPSGRDFVTLSSVNSYDLFSNDNRPKYLNVGAAIKYYFRP